MLDGVAFDGFNCHFVWEEIGHLVCSSRGGISRLEDFMWTEVLAVFPKLIESFSI